MTDGVCSVAPELAGSVVTGGALLGSTWASTAWSICAVSAGVAPTGLGASTVTSGVTAVPSLPRLLLIPWSAPAAPTSAGWRFSERARICDDVEDLHALLGRALLHASR